MMDLILLAAGLALITCIARYNENDNLFWKLAIAYLGSFAAAKVVTYVIDSNEQNKNIVINGAPTQVQQSIPCIYTLAEMSLAATRREKSPKPVSKDSAIKSNDSVLSKVHVSARGQPQVESVFPILHGPDYFDTS